MGTDHGVLHEVSWAGEMTDDYCEELYMDWDMVAAASADATQSEGYDEIDENGSNIWRFDAHFSDRPKHMLDGCNYSDDSNYWAFADNFRYNINNGDEDKGEVYLTDPAPQDGDEDSSNEEMEFVLDIIAGTGTYAAIGAAVGKYLISGGSDSCDVKQKNNGAKYIFDIDLDGDYDDLPREEDEEAKATQVSLRVNNELNEGDYGTLEFLPEYTFGYRIKDTEFCSCNEFDIKYKTIVSDDTAFPTYESV
jgi:hypothetical protein